jgi:flagellin
LDRLKTLATQAASSTFTGNFTTLNNEFQNDISELNRQAANIGLSTGGQFNQALGVYVGGGIGNNNGQQIGTALENVNLANVTAFYLSAAATATQVTGSYNQSSYSQYGFTASNATQAVVFSQGTSGYSVFGGTTVNLGFTNTSSLVATLNLAGQSSVAAVTATQLAAVDAYSLGLAVGTAATAATNLNILGTAQAQQAITAIASAVQNLGKVQGVVGAGINQLNFSISLAQSQITNYTADEAGIRDANVAQEASNLTKAQVLSQSSLAALAQANQQPQLLLKLLQ